MAELMEIPGYKIIDTLGEGGMATVYLAIQESFEREVALKVMSPNLSKDPTFGERFLREARIVSRLVHPNIVTVYDVGVHEGHHYLSMEYVPGEDLKQRRYELDLVQSLQVVKDVARALDYAGRKGYVHRDVKPENIMLHAEESRAVLMDFGIARATDVASGMTQTGTTMGTPHYMSPEQAKGAKVDPRCDIYSLGVVLFELVAGYVPFDADSAVAVGIMHVSDEVPRLAPHLHIFQPIIDKALAKKPDERYQQASQLIADLNALAAGDVAEVMRQIESMPAVEPVDTSADTVVSAPVPTQTDSEVVDKKPRAQAADAFHISSGDRIGAQKSSIGATEPPRRQGKLLGGILVLALLGAGGWYGNAWLTEKDSAETSLMASDIAALAPDELADEPAPADEAINDPANLADVLDSTDDDLAIEPGEAESLDLGLELEPLVKAQALTAGLNDDITLTVPLAILYRQLQQGDLGEQQAGSLGLDELADNLDTKFEQALAADDIARARLIAEAARRANLGQNFTERLQAFAGTESLTALLNEADEYLQANQLTSPADANALERYRQVLEADPDNARAQAGIDNIVKRYIGLAESEQEKGDLQRASTHISRGLAIDDSNDILLQLQTAVGEAQRQQAAQEQQALAAQQALADEAAAHMGAGRLISPREGNAYESYQALIALRANSTQAQEGLARIERALIADIEQLINTDQLQEATLLLASARDRYPQSQALFSLRLSL
ncbi:MAG TPA: protein kinase, partial [Cellvibrionaceae bacterium]